MNKQNGSKVVKDLNLILADSIVFYQKLHHYHWEVEGQQFFELHEQFEKMYKQWAEIMDDVAERVMTVGGTPIRTLTEALKTASIKEDGTNPEAHKMVINSLEDMSKQLKNIKTAISSAEKTNDRGTAAMLDGMVEQVEKTGWMLEAMASK